jgi:hypothetical protein
VKEKFNDILDRAIALIESRGELADFLEHHRKDEPDLLGLLEVARQLSEADAPQLSERRRESLRTELLALANQAHRPRWTFVPRWSRRVSLSFSAILLLTTGVAAAAGTSSPGTVLYPVKRAAEQARLSLAVSSEAKARLRLLYAERRMEESRRVVDHPRAFHRAINEMSRETIEAEKNASVVSQEKKEDLMAELLALTERQQETLRGVAASAPESAREAIERAVENSRRGHDRAIKMLVGEPEIGKPETPSSSHQKKRAPSSSPAVEPREEKREPSRGENRSGDAEHREEQQR